MKLSFPITPELLTLAFATCQRLESELRLQSDLSLLQFRAMALMQQNESIAESRLIDELGTSASQLSQNLGNLTKRNIAASKSISGSAKSWALTLSGQSALDEADIVLIEVYNEFFSRLDDDVEEGVRAGLRLTSQSHGIIRVKDGRFFDEQAYFESVLPVVQIVINNTQLVGLSPAQFRVLFELVVGGPALKAHLASKLLLTRSTIGWACKTLEEGGFVYESRRAPGKADPVVLTKAGRVLAERAVMSIDRACCDMRVWSPDEKLLYQQVAEYFVESFVR